VRLLGHPVHVMLVHFPVALWPAHLSLHLLATRLPDGAAVAVGFWLLVAGTGLGLLAALAGLSDLVILAQAGDRDRLRHGLTHAVINGGTLAGFTVLTALEYASFPSIRHDAGFLSVEAALLGAMAVGNYFGGTLVWPKPATKGQSHPS
jgi:uncharacterized membrane protein